MVNYTQKLVRARVKEAKRKAAEVRSYKWVMVDQGNCEINGVQEVEARNFGHALQKIVASLPTDEYEVARIEVFR